MTGYICSSPLYEYEYEGKVWTFEVPSYGSPWPINKDGEPAKRAGKRFYEMFNAFCEESEEDREEYRIGGGCEVI